MEENNSEQTEVDLPERATPDLATEPKLVPDPGLHRIRDTEIENPNARSRT